MPGRLQGNINSPEKRLIKEMLDRLLEARLNEKVKNRAEEKDFIRRAFGPPL